MLMGERVLLGKKGEHAGQGVHLLDAAGILAQNSPDGIPGLNFFYEHVHLNFAGNYLLALNFAEQAKKLLPGINHPPGQGKLGGGGRVQPPAGCHRLGPATEFGVS